MVVPLGDRVAGTFLGDGGATSGESGTSVGKKVAGTSLGDGVAPSGAGGEGDCFLVRESLGLWKERLASGRKEASM